MRLQSQHVGLLLSQLHAALVGVTHTDTAAVAGRLAEKLWQLRILDDERSAADVGAPILVVSQFTLAADISGGNRPSFTGAADPGLGRELYDYLVAQAAEDDEDELQRRFEDVFRSLNADLSQTHNLRFISPDQFNLLQSIDLLLMIVIGGLGSVHGVFLGAIFLIILPQGISAGKEFLPEFIGQAPGLKSVIYGSVLIAFVLFEPMGLYGRWLKVRTYLQMFPFYRKGMFKRQKSFQKSDRLK